MNGYVQATGHDSAGIYLWMKLLVKLHTVAGETYWHILCYMFWFPLFLLVSNVVTVTNIVSTSLFDLRVDHINPGTFGVACTSRCSRLSGPWMPLCHSMADWTSAAQSSALSFRLSKAPFRFSQCSVSEKLSSALSSSLSTGWRLIRLIPRTCNIWIRRPWRSFADKAGGIGDLSDNLNAATPSCWKIDQDALTISSVSKMYPTAVIDWFSAQDCFWLARWLWLPCHISITSWNLAILCNVHFSASLFISGWFPVFTVSNGGSSITTIPELARANNVTMTFLPNGLASRFWLPPADNILPMGTSGLNSETMWYDTENVSSRVTEIVTLSVRFLPLSPPVGDIR